MGRGQHSGLPLRRERDFAPDTVLLVGEGEADKGGSVET
jgi:hypothetical protein